MRVVAKKGALDIADEIRFRYETEKWGKPVKLALERKSSAGGVVTLEARLLDDRGRQCLDARNAVQFAIAGDGELIEYLGTAAGTRKVELANGRAVVHARLKKGEAVVSVAPAGVPTAFVTVKG